MIKLDTKDPTLAIRPTAEPDHPAIRLIVPVTDADADLATVAPRLLQLADNASADILLLGLCDAADEALSMRRALATLAALLNNGSVSATFEVMVGGEWHRLVKSRWQPGDTVVCLDERATGPSKKALRQAIERDVDMPLLFLSMERPQEHSQQAQFAQAAALAGSIAIILGFLVLQIQAGNFAGKFTGLFQLAILCIEVGLIIGWNALLG